MSLVSAGCWFCSKTETESDHMRRKRFRDPCVCFCRLKTGEAGSSFIVRATKIISRSSSVVSFLCCAFRWRKALALTTHRISRRLPDSTCRSLPRLLPPDRLSGGRGQRRAHLYRVYPATVHQAGSDYGCWARVTGCYWQAYLLPTDCRHAAVCRWRAVGSGRRCYIRPWSVCRWRQAAGGESFWECVRRPSGYCPVERVPQEVLGFPLLSPACGSDPGAVLGAGACCRGLLRGCRSLQSPLVSASSCLGSSMEESHQTLRRTKETANLWGLTGQPYLVLARTPGGRTRRASLRLLNSESNNPKTRLTQEPSHTLVLMSASVDGYLLTDCATLCLLPLAWSCSLSRWTNEWAAKGEQSERLGVTWLQSSHNSLHASHMTDNGGFKMPKQLFQTTSIMHIFIYVMRH